ncbi:MAG: hypothetical protein R3D66_06700, partial [Alphaproteobacteria bacterium]
LRYALDRSAATRNNEGTSYIQREKEGVIDVSAMRQAMERLYGAIGYLDNAVGTLERSMAGQQRDMFGSMSGDTDMPPALDAGEAIDPALIALHLDRVIEKVETVLGRA